MDAYPHNARFVAVLIALTAVVLTPLTADAEEILVLVTEKSVTADGDEQSDYWWASTVGPAWTSTDDALRESMTGQGAQLAANVDLSQLSAIYRRPEPTDANAVAMASVFGVDKVLVGTITYFPAELQPVGLQGVRAVVDVRLFDRSTGAKRRLAQVELDRRTWGADADEATDGVRREVATAIARTIAGSLERRSGPVGIATDELLIGVEGDKTRAAIDAIRAKLGTLAGISATQVRWASEGLIVLEINPGADDSDESIRQYISLLVGEGAGDYAVAAVESQWANVATLRARRAEQENP